MKFAAILSFALFASWSALAAPAAPIPRIGSVLVELTPQQIATIEEAIRIVPSRCGSDDSQDAANACVIGLNKKDIEQRLTSALTAQNAQH